LTIPAGEEQERTSQSSPDSSIDSEWANTFSGLIKNEIGQQSNPALSKGLSKYLQEKGIGPDQLSSDKLGKMTNPVDIAESWMNTPSKGAGEMVLKFSGNLAYSIINEPKVLITGRTWGDRIVKQSDEKVKALASVGLNLIGRSIRVLDELADVTRNGVNTIDNSPGPNLSKSVSKLSTESNKFQNLNQESKTIETISTSNTVLSVVNQLEQQGILR